MTNNPNHPPTKQEDWDYIEQQCPYGDCWRVHYVSCKIHGAGTHDHKLRACEWSPSAPRKTADNGKVLVKCIGSFCTNEECDGEGIEKGQGGHVHSKPSWIDELVRLVEDEKKCEQGNECYMNDIIRCVQGIERKAEDRMLSKIGAWVKEARAERTKEIVEVINGLERWESNGDEVVRFSDLIARLTNQEE